MTFPYKTLILVRFNVCVTPGTSSRSFFPGGRGGTKSQSKPPLPPPPPMTIGIYLKHAFLITDQSLQSFASQRKERKGTNQNHLQGLKHLGPSIHARKSFPTLWELQQNRLLLDRERRQNVRNTYPVRAVQSRGRKVHCRPRC